MKKIVELAFRGYQMKADEIEEGIITMDNIEWVAEHLMLELLTNEELSQMWRVVYDYFTDITAEKDEDGKIIAWKPYSEEVRFADDTRSAWLEVINLVARNRKELGLL